MLQIIIVIAVVAAAGIYLVRRTFRQAKGTGGCESGCGSGCDCSLKGETPKPVDILDSLDAKDSRAGDDKCLR